MNRLLTAVLVSLATLGACAQSTPVGPKLTQPNLAGELYASNFGQWKVPQGNLGQYSWNNSSYCYASSGGTTFQAFTVNTPVQIIDTDTPAHDEMVTPSVVTILPTTPTSRSSCSIVINPTYGHDNFYFQSATAGLQEGINWAGTSAYNVIVGPDWSLLGGTTAMIISATGNSSVSISDQRTAAQAGYTWSGSAYAATWPTGGGVVCTGTGIAQICTFPGTVAAGAALAVNPTGASLPSVPTGGTCTGTPPGSDPLACVAAATIPTPSVFFNSLVVGNGGTALVKPSACPNTPDCPIDATNPLPQYASVYNTFFGANAGLDTNTGYGNSFFGTGAGGLNTNGDQNTFLGWMAGYGNLNGYHNTYVGGSDVAFLLGYGYFNTFIGTDVDLFGTDTSHSDTVSQSVAIGTSAASHWSGGATNNVCIGIDCGAFGTPFTGKEDTYVGGYAGGYNTTGSYNTAIGEASCYTSTTAGNMLCAGYEAGELNTATGNTFLGASSGVNNTSGNQQLFAGAYSGIANTTGSSNTFLGEASGSTNTTQGSNTYVGSLAGEYETGASNTIVGPAGVGTSGANLTGSNNVFIAPLVANSATSAYSDVVIGEGSGESLTTGYDSVIIGNGAFQSGTTGYLNDIIGENAGFSETTGYNNVFNGANAGYTCNGCAGDDFTGADAGYGATTATGDVANGNNAGYGITTGSFDVFIGAYAGYSDATGAGNAYVGDSAGYYGTGGKNVGIGESAGGTNLTSGNYDTFLGYSADTTPGAATATNATAVGNGAQVGASNTIQLGNTSVTNVNTSGAYTSASLVTCDPSFGSCETRTYSYCETAGAPTSVNTGSATTTTGVNCLRVNSVIDSVTYRVTTAITTAASFTVGITGSTSQFCSSQSTLTLGATGVCFAQTGSSAINATAAPVIVTFNTTPGAGALRIIVHYHTWSAPTS